ncbi:unnamed protein product [Rhodiola kirilowii]
MKREGRQHGMVRTYRILPAPLNQTNKLRFVNRIDTPPTAGLFTKVSSKPTNHSKSTGLTNSKANKSESRNNKRHKAIFSDGVHFSGSSASGVVSTLYQYQHEEEYEDAYLDQRYGLYEIEQNPTDDNYSEDEVEMDDQELNQLTIVEQLKPCVVDRNDDHEFQDAAMNLNEQVDKEESGEDDDEIVVEEDGGTVTIGEVVILLEQVANEEADWCFVGADADQF